MVRNNPPAQRLGQKADTATPRVDLRQPFQMGNAGMVQPGHAGESA
jgi:hypothetical protein